MLYIDYLSDGFWAIGDRVENGKLAYPRVEVCRCLRRLVALAKNKYPGVRISIGEVAVYVLQVETWRHEGWGDPEGMFTYLREHSDAVPAWFHGGGGSVTG